MTRIAITPKDEQHWKELRTHDVTSTECAALFNASPYLTRFELWHQKRSGEIVELDSDRIWMGREMEPVIARIFSYKYGLKLRAYKRYIRDDADRIGASFDYEICGLRDEWLGKDESLRELYRELGSGLVECKNVDYFIARRAWMGAGEESEAPDHIEFQLQHQLEVCGKPWGAIAGFIGGNDLKVLARRHDARFGQVLRLEARKFWASVQANDPPAPVMPDDADAVIALYQHAEPGKVADLREDDDAAQLAYDYQRGHDMAKEGEEIKRSARAMLLERIGEAERAFLPGYKISAAPVSPSKGKLVTEDMVGTYIGGRRGYRGFKLTATEESHHDSKEESNE